jgi:hypothetical protein
MAYCLFFWSEPGGIFERGLRTKQFGINVRILDEERVDGGFGRHVAV